MERLTNNALKIACDYFVSFGSKEERAKYRMLAENAPKYEELYKKLAEYEDLEEQGLLKRLPVKEGSTVYILDHRYACQYDWNCPFRSYEEYKCEHSVCEYEYNKSYIREAKFNHVMTDIIGDTVFLNKEEAERALTEMNGE